jgi:uncharacterized membrane protein
MIRGLTLIGLINIAISAIGLLLAYFVLSDRNASLAYSLITITIAVITFFGLLMLPGGVEENGSISESRIRFCITATFVLVYITFFGITTFWDEKEKSSEYMKILIPTLTTLLSVVVAFYFGATAAVEAFGKRNDKKP